MGSIDKACISGFLCRLCSEMHRIVIHIYGDQGQRLCLVEKINGYLPITISPTDPLPKTICTTCLRRVEQHYDLLMRLSKIKERKFLRVDKEHRRRVQETADLISSLENSDDEVYHSDDESRRRRQQQQDQTQERQSPQSQQQEQTLPLTTSVSTAPSSSLSAVIAASFSTASITTDSNSMNVASPESEDEDNGVADESAASTSASALTTLTQNFVTIADSTSSASSTPFNNHTHSVEVDQSFVDNVVGGVNSFGIVSQQNND